MVGEYLEILDMDSNNTGEKGVGKTGIKFADSHHHPLGYRLCDPGQVTPCPWPRFPHPQYVDTDTSHRPGLS